MRAYSIQTNVILIKPGTSINLFNRTSPGTSCRKEKKRQTENNIEVMRCSPKPWGALKMTMIIHKVGCFFFLCLPFLFFGRGGVVLLRIAIHQHISSSYTSQCLLSLQLTTTFSMYYYKLPLQPSPPQLQMFTQINPPSLPPPPSISTSQPHRLTHRKETAILCRFDVEHKNFFFLIARALYLIPPVSFSPLPLHVISFNRRANSFIFILTQTPTPTPKSPTLPLPPYRYLRASFTLQ